MITKEEFKKRIDTLRRFYSDGATLADSLHKTLLNGHSVVCFGDNLMNIIIHDTAQMAEMDEELLSDFVFDGEVRLSVANEPVRTLVTPDELWDFYNEHNDELH